ncbi:MAG: tetratricopeptide repeat protein [Symploca sp. SIO3C6]|uniref:Tetratricopeptide repeat protein n=1 Tax=Symploca sp. SIO1C4 TaxID=2607765 RepID=A0A6B3NJX3_9CYAN|nr:tetratricopeptide repeat protein [Symploca sp. SIO3C6]NER31927.1 tetratricopeptide repeat protein [Symploca sp. SIO1C4]NET05972.1 tetratricopeptide repeat protein [Symploca sp. SIO2B6]
MMQVEGWFNQGNQQYRVKDWVGAVASYDKILEIKPDSYEAWYNKASALKSLRRYEKAVASYDQALELQPDSHFAWSNRGIALKNLGRLEEAIESYDKALKLKPDSHFTWSKRGIALVSCGRLEEAVESYDQALAIESGKHETWNNRGIALGNLGRLQEAIESYDKALELKPDKYETWYNRGVDLGELERYEEAIESYDQALKLKLDFWQAWIGRGSAAGSSTAVDPKPTCLTELAEHNQSLNQRGYEGRLASYKEGLRHCHQQTHPEGWGWLHWRTGKAHYLFGEQSSKPDSFWLKAIVEYVEATKTLTEFDFPEYYLEILQDLIKIFFGLKQTAEAEKLQRRGSDLLRRLLDEPNRSTKNKELLAQKFSSFN